MTDDDDHLRMMDWEEWLEHTDLETDENQPASEILGEWRRQRSLAPTYCRGCGARVDPSDRSVQADWKSFDGEKQLRVGTVTYCPDCLPPGMQVE